MSKRLKLFGVLLLVVLVFAIAGIAKYSFQSAATLDPESKAYVDTTIPILVKDWNPDELKSRAGKELEPYFKEPDISNLYAQLKQLGRMTNYKGSEGQAHIGINIPNGLSITARYVATADFEKGPATIKLSAVKRSGF